MLFYYPSHNIGVGYKGDKNTLEGHNFKTGRLVWKREINREYSWNDEDLYFNYFIKNGKNFLTKENKTYVVDKSGRLIAEFLDSANSTFLNGKLYNIQDTKLVEVDLKNIIKSLMITPS